MRKLRTLFFMLGVLFTCSPFIMAQKSLLSRAERKALEEGDPSVRVTNLSKINRPTYDFGPAYYANGLVYVSQYIAGPKEKNTGETSYKLFFAELDANNTPHQSQLFSLTLNSSYNEGPACFSKDQSTIYFTQTNTKNGAPVPDKKGNVHLNIYQGKKGVYDWEDITRLPFNSDVYGSMHPSLSNDGKKLFFASDREQGHGGFDIYFVIKQGNSWSEPINLGPEVNTPGDETFPFIHESGVLFFTSSGHSGLGGLDLFMVDMGPVHWEVVNLGKPFNSKYDDLSFILDPSGTKGYFSSSRKNGVGKDDLFLFKAPNGINGKKIVQPVPQKILVIDKKSGSPIKNATVKLIALADNEGQGRRADNQPQRGSDGSILTAREGMASEEVIIQTNKGGFAMGQIGIGKSYLIVAQKNGYQTNELVYQAKQKTRQVIEIALTSSECLELNGVVLDEQTGKPIDGAKVRIVQSGDQSSVELETNFEGRFFHCLPIGYDFEMMAQKNGFTYDKKSVSTISLRGIRTKVTELHLRPSGPLDLDIWPEKMTEGTVLILKNLYFESNGTAISSGAAKDLEKLIRLMNEEPTMEIELGAHTDVVGTEEYNLGLSLGRAESAKKYLVRRGIAKHRIKAVGYGEAFVRNHCVEGVSCSDEEHQYNRRVEMRVTHIKE